MGEQGAGRDRARVRSAERQAEATAAEAYFLRACAWVASSTNFWGAEPLQKLCHVLPITVGTDGTYLPRFPIFFWSLDLEFQKLIAAAAAAKYR